MLVAWYMYVVMEERGIGELSDESSSPRGGVGFV